MLKVFISYRREDSPYVAHVIHDKLSEHFGRENIIFDVDSVPPGIDFRKFLHEQVEQCDTLLAVIGDKWLNLLQKKSQEPPDYVLTEIEAALTRNIPVIPVLVDKATIPKEQQLPREIADLSYRTGVEVRGGSDLLAHLKKLTQALEYYSIQDTPTRYHAAPANTEPNAALSDIQHLLKEIALLDTTPSRRLEIGDELAAKGDPRPGVGLDSHGLPEADWVKIPGGEFIYGEGIEQRTLHLDTYYMARYPVTNIQYQAFIEAGGYNNKHWWRKLEKPELGNSLWPQANRPRTNVSWDEAMAFCRWLSHQLDIEVRLPTEQEWENAAVTPDYTVFPWGNKYKTGFANVNEVPEKQGRWYLQQTTAVGLYPQGQTPNGLHDVTGNIWEWCLNQYEQPEQIDIANPWDKRTMRGGSWAITPMIGRPLTRIGEPPGTQHPGAGFRILSPDPCRTG